MHRWLSLGTVAIAIGLAVMGLLGPFVFDTIDYGFSETIRNQAVGLDAASLLIVAPVAAFSAAYAARALTYCTFTPLLGVRGTGRTAHHWR